MENLLAILLVAVVVATTTLLLKVFIKRRAEKKRLDQIAIAEAQAALARDMERRRQQKLAKVSANTPPSTARKMEQYRKETSPSYAPSPTQSVQSSDDGFVNGMLTGMLIDSVVNSITHKSGGSNPIDFPKVDNTPSWGLDDSDSRKSVSSSMDTSSYDSFSSSDSGPSSDW